MKSDLLLPVHSDHVIRQQIQGPVLDGGCGVLAIIRPPQQAIHVGPDLWEALDPTPQNISKSGTSRHCMARHSISKGTGEIT